MQANLNQKKSLSSNVVKHHLLYKLFIEKLKSSIVKLGRTSTMPPTYQTKQIIKNNNHKQITYLTTVKVYLLVYF